jgi:PAS domain S-box-containing protein
VTSVPAVVAGPLATGRTPARPPDIVAVVDDRARIVFVSGASATVLGYCPPQLLRTIVWRLLPDAERGRVMECVATAPPPPHDLTITHDLVRADGTNVTVETWMRTAQADTSEQPHTVLICRLVGVAADRSLDGGPAAPSPRELEVLHHLIDGYDIRQIATDLDISVNTVRSYVRSLLRKLDVQTQLQAVVRAIRLGWVAMP